MCALFVAVCHGPVKGCEAMRRHRSCRTEMVKQLSLVHIDVGVKSYEGCALCVVLGTEVKRR